MERQSLTSFVVRTRILGRTVRKRKGSICGVHLEEKESKDDQHAGEDRRCKAVHDSV